MGKRKANRPIGSIKKDSKDKIFFLPYGTHDRYRRGTYGAQCGKIPSVVFAGGDKANGQEVIGHTVHMEYHRPIYFEDAVKECRNRVSAATLVSPEL